MVLMYRCDSEGNDSYGKIVVTRLRSNASSADNCLLKSKTSHAFVGPIKSGKVYDEHPSGD